MPRLREHLRQSRDFASPQEEAFLELQRSAGLLHRELSRLLRSAGPPGIRFTMTHYNVLRILRGSHPWALSCGEIGRRLVTPVPDVTRLVDRLTRVDLVARQRDDADRRVVRVVISAPGLELLAGLDDPVNAWLENELGHLSGAELDTLVHLLAKVRSVLEPTCPEEEGETQGLPR